MSRVVHFEIHASDPEKLSAFYAAAFGWTVTPLPHMSYWLLNTGEGDGINGGMMKRVGPAAGEGAAVNGFVCSLGVGSVDDALARALDSGASLAQPKLAIPGVGWQAYVKDPDGNLVGLHQPDTSAK